MPELGTSTTTWTKGYPEDAAEYVPDLTWPQSVTVYDRMRTDASAEEAVRGVSLPISKAGWHLAPGDARPEVVAHFSTGLGVPILGQARFAGRNRTRGRVQFSQHIREALLSLIYGHSVFEQVWEKQADGYMHLVRLAPRPAHSIHEINVDGRGDLTGIKQYVPGVNGTSPRIVEIPASQLVFYSHAREGAAWQGRSMLRAAYRHWTIKDKLLRIDAIAAERHGIGTPIINAPEGATAEQIAELSVTAQEYRGGSAAGGALPYGATLSVVGVTGNLHETLASIRYQDEQIARTALRTFAMLGSTANGSRALGETLMDDFILSLQAEAEDLATTLQEQLIEPMGDWNWGSNEPLPTITFTPIGADPELTVEALSGLVTAGLVTADDDLEGYVRQRFDLPERTPITGVAAGAGGAAVARGVGELIQKLYLGVDKVITADEAREIANRAGAGLTGSLPTPEPDQVALGKAPAREVRAAAVTLTAEEKFDLLDDLEAELAPEIRDAFGQLVDTDELAEDFAASGITAEDGDSDRAVLVGIVAVWLAAWLLTRPANTAPLTAAIEKANTVGYGVGRGATGTANEILAAMNELPGTAGLDDMLDTTPDVVEGITTTRLEAVTGTLTDTTIDGGDVAEAVTGTLTDDTTVNMVTITETNGGHTIGVLDEIEDAVEPGEPKRYRYVADPTGACPLCVANHVGHSKGEAQGVYRDGDDPPNGYPSVHPNCKCIIGFI